MPDDILFAAEVSAPRRWLGVGILVTLGLLLLYLAALRPPGSAGLLAFLVATGLAALALGLRMYRATQARLELTADGVRSSDGRMVARLSSIRSVDRGTFAYKPSNGFLLRLEDSAGPGWEPGLWWRLGRRVGVGGVVSGAQSKAMAEMISAMLAARGAGRMPPAS